MCQIWSMEPKTKFQSQNIESSVLPSLNIKDSPPLFKTNTTKFLHLTRTPICNSQNHITMTIPLISPSWFLISADIPATFHSLLTVIIMIMYALPSLFLLDISNQSRPHPYAWSSIDSFDVLFLILLEGNRGRICGTVILKSAVIYSNVLGLQIHSLLTHRLTDQLPVLQDLFMVSVVSAYTIAHSIQYNNVLCNL